MQRLMYVCLCVCTVIRLHQDSNGAAQTAWSTVTLLSMAHSFDIAVHLRPTMRHGQDALSISLSNFTRYVHPNDAARRCSYHNRGVLCNLTTEKYGSHDLMYVSRLPTCL